jgi:hypothetical protein
LSRTGVVEIGSESKRLMSGFSFLVSLPPRFV